MNLAKSIIQEAIIPFEEDFIDAFRSSISQVGEDLFERARLASNNEEEQDVYSQYHLLKNQASPLAQYAKVHVGDMPKEMLHLSNTHNDDQSKDSLLSIVGYTELDIVLAYSQLESLLDVRFYSQIFLLEKRNKALFSAQEVDKTIMPFGPSSISWILKKVLEYEEFNARTQVMIITQMATALSASLAKTYERINEVYVSYRILPNLKPEVKKSSAAGKGGAVSQQAQEATEAQEAVDQASETESVANQPAGDSIQPATVGFNPAKLSNKRVSEAFDLLKHIQPPRPDHLSQVNVSAPVLDQSLAKMELPADHVLNSGSVEELKNSLNQNITDQTGLYYPVINQYQESAIDMMAHVFDQITVDDGLDKNILPSISQLQIPLLRTAIKENGFFDDENHPARQFLEKVLTASYFWHGTQVVHDIEKFSNLVSRDYDGDAETFLKVQEDLDKYLQMVTAKAENAEKRHRAQVRGRERLKNIHKAVDKFIAKLLDINNIGFIEHLLEYVLKDTLTLTLLREGKDSDEWRAQSEMVKNIVRMTHVKHHAKITDALKDTTLSQLETNMYNLGFVKSDVEQTLDELNNYHDLVKNRFKSADKEVATNEVDEIEVKQILDPPLLDEAFSHLKKQAEQSQSKSNKHDQLDSIRPLNEEERAMMEKVKGYPFGSFFDFKMEPDNERRKKMCWLSPVSNFALFVNPMGRKPVEKPIPELAIEMVEGNVEYVKPHERGFFARAIDRVYDKLKKMKSSISLGGSDAHG
ncbi:DUF1631 family protein [Marinicella sp. W31]|uniref:DUF1631 family protein n=1 Tax=Marinicella sp. W31 TaxID=3023713 RepID=UPI0037574C8E